MTERMEVEKGRKRLIMGRRMKAKVRRRLTVARGPTTTRMIRSNRQDPVLNSLHRKKCSNSKISLNHKGITPIPEVVVAAAVEVGGAVTIAEAITCLLHNHNHHKVVAATGMDMDGRIPLRVVLAQEGAIKEEIMVLREEVVDLVEDGNLPLENSIPGKVEGVVEVEAEVVVDPEGMDEDRV